MPNIGHITRTIHTLVLHRISLDQVKGMDIHCTNWHVIPALGKPNGYVGGNLNLPCFPEYIFYRKLSLSDGYIIALLSCLVFLVPGTSQYLTLSPSPIRLKLTINRIMNLRGISGQDPV